VKQLVEPGPEIDTDGLVCSTGAGAGAGVGVGAGVLLPWLFDVDVIVVVAGVEVDGVWLVAGTELWTTGSVVAGLPTCLVVMVL
jgi:hypothetical protein